MRLRRSAVLITVALAAFAPGAAQAACAAPTLQIEPKAARAGEEITIEGVRWVDGCRDHGSCSACGGCDYGPAPVPMNDIEIKIGPQQVATVDADESGGFKVEVRVPDLPPGKYQVAGGSFGAEYGLPRLTILPNR